MRDDQIMGTLRERKKEKMFSMRSNDDLIEPIVLI